MLHDFYDVLHLLYKSEKKSLCKRTSNAIFILCDCHIKHTSFRDIMRVASQVHVLVGCSWSFVMSKPIRILLGADWCRHCQNWPCLLSWCHLHIPYHHSNSIFFFLYPCLSVRAVASKILNRVKLLR